MLHLLREFAMDRLRGKHFFAWLTGVPLLAFIYEMKPNQAEESGFDDVHVYREKAYGLVGVSLEAYQRHQRPRSPPLASKASRRA